MATRTVGSPYESKIQYTADKNKDITVSESAWKIRQDCEVECMRALILHENNEIDNAVYTLRRLLEESMNR